MSRVDLKTLVIGLLLGIMVMMARGATTADPALSQRYQISAVHDASQSSYIYVLDHKTNKVYRSYNGNMPSDAMVLEIKTPD